MKILLREGGGYDLMTNVGFHHATQVVIAADARAPHLLQPLCIKVPLETERGYAADAWAVNDDHDIEQIAVIWRHTDGAWSMGGGSPEPSRSPASTRHRTSVARKH